MEKSLDTKLAALKENSASQVFILADAKDADMAFGIASPGKHHHGALRSLAEYRDQMREIVAQGLIDIMLMSASTSESLTIRERIFDASAVTAAVRANDATDIHIVRGSRYSKAPSRPFATATIDQIQSGHDQCADTERSRGADLGLYSVTFNNDPENDFRTLDAYKTFRLEAERKQFRHFLEVFEPNVSARQHRITGAEIPYFMNDHIVRMLAGVPSTGRPLFLKIPYRGPQALEELCRYDPSLIVGVLGGSAGTTFDAFSLLHEAKRYGARIALFGRKINAAEDQLAFVRHLRMVADNVITPGEAVKSYHGALSQVGIRPHRSLKQDMEATVSASAYISA